MAYEEMVLRFFAYYENKSKRVDNLANFLRDFMKEKQNCDVVEINKLRDLFTQTLEKVFEYLGEDAFTISIVEKKNNKGSKKANRALYDAEMLAFASLVDGSEERSPIEPNKFKDKLRDFINGTSEESKNFRQSLNEQSGGRKIQDRVNKIKDILFQNA